MRSRPPDKSDASVTRLPVATAGRIRRHPVYRPLNDPVVQGLLAVMGAVLFGAFAWALRGHGLSGLGAVSIAAAVGCVGAFLLLVGRAMERDKLVEYWQDRRELRLELRRRQAELDLARISLENSETIYASRFDGAADDARIACFVLIVNAAHACLAARHDDVAVLLWERGGDRRRVLHASTSPGSRFSVLRSGKSCLIRGDAAETLQGLAPYHSSFMVDEGFAAVGVAVLSYAPFDDEDLRLIASFPACFGASGGRESASDDTLAKLRYLQRRL